MNVKLTKVFATLLAAAAFLAPVSNGLAASVTWTAAIASDPDPANVPEGDSISFWLEDEQFDVTGLPDGEAWTHSDLTTEYRWSVNDGAVTGDGNAATVASGSTATVKAGNHSIKFEGKTGYYPIWFEEDNTTQHTGAPVYVDWMAIGSRGFTVVKIDKLQYKLNGSWTDAPGSFSDIGLLTTITFRVVPYPSGASWPKDCPLWGGTAEGVTGDTNQIIFPDTGGQTVSVECGNTVSAGVAVDTANTVVSVIWDTAEYTQNSTTGNCTAVPKQFTVNYTASADIDSNKWMLRILDIHGGIDILVRTGGYRNPLTNPPTTEAEAVDAVTKMKAYYARGSVSGWHITSASRTHENYHYTEWSLTGSHYWPSTETAIEEITTTYHDHATEASAITAMRSGGTGSDSKVTAYKSICWSYWDTLADAAGSRPYAAGQLALNPAIQIVQALAATNGWTVPQGVDTPSIANPCYKAWLPYTP